MTNKQPDPNKCQVKHCAMLKRVVMIESSSSGQLSLNLCIKHFNQVRDGKVLEYKKGEVVGRYIGK